MAVIRLKHITNRDRRDVKRELYRTPNEGFRRQAHELREPKKSRAGARVP